MVAATERQRFASARQLVRVPPAASVLWIILVAMVPPAAALARRAAGAASPSANPSRMDSAC